MTNQPDLKIKDTTRLDSSLNPRREHNPVASLHSDLNNLVTDVESSSQQTQSGEDIKGTLEKLNERVKVAKHAVEESSKTAAASVQQQANKMFSAANNQLHDRPWYFLGISALAAVVLGYLLANRKPTRAKL